LKRLETQRERRRRRKAVGACKHFITRLSAWDLEKFERKKEKERGTGGVRI